MILVPSVPGILFLSCSSYCIVYDGRVGNDTSKNISSPSKGVLKSEIISIELALHSEDCSNKGNF